MTRIKPHSLGLGFGIFLGLWHTCWALLVWFGAAQWLIDFIFRLHMITPPYKISAFNIGAAVSLVAVTACVGFVGGFFMAIIWNSFVASNVRNA